MHLFDLHDNNVHNNQYRMIENYNMSGEVYDDVILGGRTVPYESFGLATYYNCAYES